MSEKMKYATIFLTPLTALCIIAALAIDSDKIADSNPVGLPKAPAQKGIEYFKYNMIRDTIFVLGDEYITISIKDQTAQAHFRDSSRKTYKISTGTSRISRGVKTPTGIFSVQSKYKVLRSRQFNSKLLYWVGFNYSIGFHAIRSDGYYRHLGKRPSSHGCVRISREDGKSLFQQVELGTPVMVYDNFPARVFAFAEPEDFNPERDIMIKAYDREQRKLLSRRLENLYAGLAPIENRGRVFIDGKTILHPGGVDPGSASKIALRQKYPRKIQTQSVAVDALSADCRLDVAEAVRKFELYKKQSLVSNEDEESKRLKRRTDYDKN